MTLFNRFASFGLLVLLAACGNSDPLEEDLPDMGDFRLAYNIVVADNMQQVPPSRNATAEEWVEVMTAEIDRRFGAYEGDRLYHIAINIDGYALAPPGIPIVLTPRSVLVISANIWDDEAQMKLHEEPEQILIFEGSSPESMLVGSGLAFTREEQMQRLARNAARRIQIFMLDNPEWFSIDPDAARNARANVEAVAAAVEPAVALPEDVTLDAAPGTPPDTPPNTTPGAVLIQPVGTTTPRPSIP